MAQVRTTFYTELNEKKIPTACAEELENQEIIKKTPFVKTKQNKWSPVESVCSLLIKTFAVSKGLDEEKKKKGKKMETD